MRRVLVVGIGAGDPEHLTVAGIAALNRADALLVVAKGDAAGTDLATAREEIVARYVDPDRRPRRVDLPETARDRDASDYEAAVGEWRAGRLAAYAEAIAGLGQDETAAFLVWGDPSLYDGTLLLLDEITSVPFDVEVIPGISAAALLAARHRIPLNRAGESILVTTGRRLRTHGIPDGVDNVVVFLDRGQAWLDLDADVDIWWGAFLGTPDELLVSGRLVDVRDELARVRAAGRERKGWMFDTYLLRRRR